MFVILGGALPGFVPIHASVAGHGRIFRRYDSLLAAPLLANWIASRASLLHSRDKSG